MQLLSSAKYNIGKDGSMKLDSPNTITVCLWHPKFFGTSYGINSL